MICAVFFRNSDDVFTGFSFKDHALFADSGQDVCCASVSSAVMLTANTITEKFGIDADITINEKEGEISLSLKDDENENGSKLIDGLKLHIDQLENEFPGYIRVREKEV